MQTKLLYNYKSADTELSARLSGLERKLSFGENENLEDKVGAAVENAMSVEIAAREAADERFTEQLAAMQDEIDGSISTWFEEGEPTLENEPAATWDEDDELPKHVGDLYYDTETGYCYRFQNVDGGFDWQLIRDTDVTKALADAAAAQATANAAVKKDQGIANAGRVLTVNSAGEVSTELPTQIYLASADGLTVFALAISEGGALTISEVLPNGGE